MKVTQIPTAKNINWHQNKSFREISNIFLTHRKAININRLLIYLLIISNFLSWIYIGAMYHYMSNHDHDIDRYINSPIMNY